MRARAASVDLTASVVQTLVLYALAEHQLGHARLIAVSAQGHEFSVRDDGRGHAIQRSIDGAPYLDFIYGHLAYPFGETVPRAVQLQGLGMSLLNRLCSELKVSVRKPTASLDMRFEHGDLVEHTLTPAPNEVTGNEVSGRLDARVAASTVDEPALLRWLDEVARASPSLKLQYNGRARPCPGVVC